MRAAAVGAATLAGGGEREGWGLHAAAAELWAVSEVEERAQEGWAAAGRVREGRAGVRSCVAAAATAAGGVTEEAGEARAGVAWGTAEGAGDEGEGDWGAAGRGMAGAACTRIAMDTVKRGGSLLGITL